MFRIYEIAWLTKLSLLNYFMTTQHPPSSNFLYPYPYYISEWLLLDVLISIQMLPLVLFDYLLYFLITLFLYIIILICHI